MSLIESYFLVCFARLTLTSENKEQSADEQVNNNVFALNKVIKINKIHRILYKIQNYKK